MLAIPRNLIFSHGSGASSSQFHGQRAQTQPPEPAVDSSVVQHGVFPSSGADSPEDRGDPQEQGAEDSQGETSDRDSANPELPAVVEYLDRLKVTRGSSWVDWLKIGLFCSARVSDDLFSRPEHSDMNESRGPTFAEDQR